MRYPTLLLLVLSGCWWEECPTAGTLDVNAVDANGDALCIDDITVTGPDGAELDAVCDCWCTVDTELEGTHEVEATVGGETMTGSADLFVFERCVTPSETLELVFE